MQSSCEVTACPNPAGRALRSTRLCMPFPLPGRLSCNAHRRKLLQSMGGAELVNTGFVELRVEYAPVRHCWQLQGAAHSSSRPGDALGSVVFIVIAARKDGTSWQQLVL